MQKVERTEVTRNLQVELFTKNKQHFTMFTHFAKKFMWEVQHQSKSALSASANRFGAGAGFLLAFDFANRNTTFF